MNTVAALLRAPTWRVSSESPSAKPAGGSERTSQEEENVRKVITRAHEGGFSLQSNFAREHAQHIAAAACMDYITTLRPDGSFGVTWRPTFMGLRHLFHEVK